MIKKCYDLKLLNYIIVGFIAACFFFPQADLHCQKEAYNWYFGNRAGITFNPDGINPKGLTDANLLFNQMEGVASISDKDGKLLFYTDGMSIWSGNHYYMPNGTGLTGTPSATQSAIIVNQPGSSSIYYVFTVPEIGGDAGLRYTIVDMKLNNGFGEVDARRKNIALCGPVTEKITAVRHSNGTDIWIITHKWLSKEFKSYLLTENGITDSVSSLTGSIHYGSQYNNIGYLKASVDGTKLALAISVDRAIEIFDFNNSNGTITFDYGIYKPKEFKELYGVEFSPDGSKLYVTESFQDDASIYQFNLKAGSPSAIASTYKTIASYREFGAVQLGPDGKIYVAINGAKFLGVINDPNNDGTDCNYNEFGVDLKERECRYGLPNFFPGFILSATIQMNAPLCEGSDLILKGNVPAATDNAIYNWSGPNNFTGKGKIVTIKGISKNGEGYYKLVVTDGKKVGIDSVYVKVYPKPDVSINPPGNIYICPGDYAKLTSSQIKPGYTYQWSNGENSTFININTEGTYFLILKNENGCVDTAYKEVKYYPIQKVTIVPEPSDIACIGDSIRLSVKEAQPDFTYKWSNGDTTPKITVKKGGAYFVMVRPSAGCQMADTTDIKFVPVPEAKIIPKGPTTICKGESALLSASPTGSEYSYLWSTGETTPQIFVSKAGRISLKVSSLAGCYDTAGINIIVNPPPVVELNYKNVVTICNGDTANLMTTAPFASYKWSNGAATRSIVVNSEGYYTVTVTDNNGCSDTAGIRVEAVKSKVEVPQEIIFTTYLSESEGTKTVSIKNISGSEILINNVFVNGKPGYFNLKPSLSIPAKVNDGESLLVDLVFSNIMEDDYSDTLIIEISSPCNQIEKIPLFVKNTGSVAWIPSDMEGEINNNDFTIPLMVKLKKNVTTNLSFTARIAFDVTLLQLNNNKKTWDTNEIIGLERLLTVSGNAAGLTNNDITVNNIYGMVLLPSANKIPLRIDDFKWNNKYIPLDIIDGSMSVKGLCKQDFLRIQLADYPILQIAPNPVNEGAVITLENGSKGTINCDIFTLQGVKIASKQIIKTDKTATITFDTHDFAPGTYEVVVHTTAEMLTGIMVVVK